jgi:hypothetical protein
MNRSQPAHLARDPDTPVSPGYRLVETEVQFLEHALGQEPLFIRGPGLCRWAETFYLGRGWPYRAVTSPVVELQSAVEELTRLQALELLSTLGDAFDRLPRPITARSIMASLYPSGPWQAEPSLDHAARWLLFLNADSFPEYVVPLLAAQARIWEHDASDVTRPLYARTTQGEAHAALAAWLRLDLEQSPPTTAPFPLPIPERWRQAARETWAATVLSRGPALLDELRRRHAPSAVLEIAAEEIARYLLHNPGQLSAAVTWDLEPFLSEESVRKLREHCPPADPGSVPDEPDAVIRWFQRSYYPYREWQSEHNSSEADLRVQELAHSFARWFLPFCASALNGGPGQNRFAFSQAATLRAARSEYVTLWVVLDGLTVGDARQVIQHLVQEPRLSVTRSDVTLAPVPTITFVCKPALFNGKPPSEVSTGEPVPTFPGARQLRDSADWQEQMAGAQKGDVFVWSLLEPDKTYHQHLNRTSIQLQVRGELATAAEKIKTAALAVASDLPVRICISTDHGRLLSAGERRHPVPEGMRSHGRAAWGRVPIPFDQSGIHWDPEQQIAYLSSSRFNLQVDCAVALDGDSFEMNDGKTGREQFPHGGVFPEEVLVPWIELARDAQALSLKCRLTGSGVADKPGDVLLTVENPSDLTLELQRVQLLSPNLPAREILLTGAVAPHSVGEVSGTLDPWPERKQLEGVEAILFALKPGQAPFEAPVEVALEVEQMYEQSLSLDDLEF